MSKIFFLFALIGYGFAGVSGAFIAITSFILVSILSSKMENERIRPIEKITVGAIALVLPIIAYKWFGFFNLGF